MSSWKGDYNTMLVSLVSHSAIITLRVALIARVPALYIFGDVFYFMPLLGVAIRTCAI